MECLVLTCSIPLWYAFNGGNKAVPANLSFSYVLEAPSHNEVLRDLVKVFCLLLITKLVAVSTKHADTNRRGPKKILAPAEPVEPLPKALEVFRLARWKALVACLRGKDTRCIFSILGKEVTQSISKLL